MKENTHFFLLHLNKKINPQRPFNFLRNFYVYIHGRRKKKYDQQYSLDSLSITNKTSVMKMLSRHTKATY